MSRSKKDGRRGGSHRNKNCRNNGSCEWCNANRQYGSHKQAQRAEAELQGQCSCERPLKRNQGLRYHDRGS